MFTTLLSSSHLIIEISPFSRHSVHFTGLKPAKGRATQIPHGKHLTRTHVSLTSQPVAVTSTLHGFLNPIQGSGYGKWKCVLEILKKITGLRVHGLQGMARIKEE